jgi:hypothetical protein
MLVMLCELAGPLTGAKEVNDPEAAIENPRI